MSRIMVDGKQVRVIVRLSHMVVGGRALTKMDYDEHGLLLLDLRLSRKWKCLPLALCGCGSAKELLRCGRHDLG